VSTDLRLFSIFGANLKVFELARRLHRFLNRAVRCWAGKLFVSRLKLFEICLKEGRRGAPVTRESHRESGNTVIEVIVGVGVLAVILATVFRGMTMSNGLTRIAREDLRATQILVERMEGIRLFNWNQLVYSNSLCPRTFTTSYFPIPDSTGSTGITYYGTLQITNVVFDPQSSYSNQMRAIMVTINWTNSGILHSRSMTGYQAQYGLQNYIFNN
jgi:hypothetical protein